MREGSSVFLLAALLLSACAPFDYHVDTLGPPANPDKFQADVTFCTDGTKGYHPTPSIDTVAGAALEGGAGSLSYLPFNAAIPVLGAAGGGAYEAQKGWDVTGQVHRNVFFNCMHDATNRDGSAFVADPH